MDSLNELSEYAANVRSQHPHLDEELLDAIKDARDDIEDGMPESYVIINTKRVIYSLINKE